MVETKDGKVLLAKEAKRQKALRKARAVELKASPKAEQARRKLQNRFNMYDIDSSGGIDRFEFGLMLKDMCVPLTGDDVDKAQFDASGTVVCRPSSTRRTHHHS